MRCARSTLRPLAATPPRSRRSLLRDRSGRARAGPCRRSARAACSPCPPGLPRLHLDELIGGSGKRSIRRRRQKRLRSFPPQVLREDGSPVWIELRQDVVKQQQRAGGAALGEQIRLGEEEGQDRQA